jgi:hypothetical protein
MLTLMTECWIFQMMFLFQAQNWIPQYLLPFLLHGTVLLEKLRVFSESQKDSCILQNPKVYYYVNNSLPLVCTISQTNSGDAWESRFFKANFHIILQSTPRSYKVSLSSDLPTETLYMYSFFTIHGTRLTHLILSDLITQMISGVEYTS